MALREKDEQKREYARKCLQNFADIFALVNEIELEVNSTKTHLNLHGAFYGQHHMVLTKDRELVYDVSREDLVDLYMDTNAYLSQLRRALQRIQEVNMLVHLYDYGTNDFFTKRFMLMMKDV